MKSSRAISLSPSSAVDVKNIVAARFINTHTSTPEGEEAGSLQTLDINSI
jgi:hypothetical protein